MATHKTPIVSSKLTNPHPDISPHPIKANGMIFVSDSIGLDEKNRMVKAGIKEHVHQIIKNFKTMLEDAVSCLEEIVKGNIYLEDMKDEEELSEAYTEHFTRPNLPSRSSIAAKEPPFQADVEMMLMLAHCGY